MSKNPTNVVAKLSDLEWMCGAWRGSFGGQQVEEGWSQPNADTMATMVRITRDGQTAMFELIVIHQLQDSLIAHLRQFSPELELLLGQNMPVVNTGTQLVSFGGPSDAAIKVLTYRGVESDRMEIDVTLADDTVVTAKMERP